MKKQSRRQFLKFCFGAALAGAGGGLLWKTFRQTDRSDVTKRAKTDPGFEPAYLKLHRSGELKRRGEELWEMMRSCRLCPRECGVDRIAGQAGFCRASSRLEISSFQPHFGEERPLVGRSGSGTIFLTNCGLRCVFCINWEISQAGEGTERTVEEMAGMMLRLQEIGCHNINCVTPTHYSPHILLALDRAADRGLKLPLVYNTCGWEKPEILKLLDGVVDIYLPDFKYSDGAMAARYSSASASYPEITQAALLEMQRQVGTAKPDRDGLVRRGLMIRHLVMPNNVAGTKGVVEWIAAHLPKETYLNIMSQYTPTYRANEYPEIARRITREEYADAVRWAKAAGLTNLEIQGYPPR